MVGIHPQQRKLCVDSCFDSSSDQQEHLLINKTVGLKQFPLSCAVQGIELFALNPPTLHCFQVLTLLLRGENNSKQNK